MAPSPHRFLKPGLTPIQTIAGWVFFIYDKYFGHANAYPMFHQGLRIILCTIFMGLVSQFGICLTPIPITGQFLGAIVIARILPPAASLLSVIWWITLGLYEWPAFFWLQGEGPSALLGPGSGYIWSFLLSVPLASWLERRSQHTSTKRMRLFQSCLVIYLVMHLIGMSVLLLHGASFSTALVGGWIGLIPFFLPQFFLVIFVWPWVEKRIFCLKGKPRLAP